MNKRLIIIFYAFAIAFSAEKAKANDPTRPFMSESGKPKSKMRKKITVKQPLTAIFIRNKRPMAIIEGKLYSKNDYYRGSQITKILKDKVLLKSSDGNFQLTLIPKIKK
jgi:hypothetical protein